MLLDLLGRLLGRKGKTAPPLSHAAGVATELDERGFFAVLRGGAVTPAQIVAHARWQRERDPLFAAALLMEAQRRAPQWGEALRELGGLHLQLGNRHSAAEAFHLALLRDETDRIAWRGLAQARRAQRREAEARYAEAQAQVIEMERRVAQADFSVTLPETEDWSAWLRFLAEAEENADPLGIEAALAKRTSTSQEWVARLALSVWLSRHARPRAGLRLAQEAHAALPPAHPALAQALALAQSALGRLDEAIVQCRASLERYGDDAELLGLLADCLASQGDNASALACYTQAVSLQPGNPMLLNNYGCTLTLLERFDEAIPPLRLALERRPDMRNARLNLAYALTYRGEHDEALALLNSILADEPSHFDAHWYRSHLLLARHDYALGWLDYRYRFVSAARGTALIPLPRWNGLPLSSGQTLLLVGEQGIGDTLMFASCLPDLLCEVERVKFAVPSRLITLLQRSFPEVELIPLDDTSHKALATFWQPLGDLPARYRNHPVAFREAKSPFLVADPKLVAEHRTRLALLGNGLKVGLAWRGGTQGTRGASRSIPLTRLAPLLGIGNCHFVSLQHGDCAAEIAASGFDLAHWPEVIADLDAFAALVASLDLIVTVCSAPAHFAGGLGKPAWVLAPHAPEWRYYGIDGQMPWYPSVRILRQPLGGLWEAPILELASRLCDLVSDQTLSNSDNSRHFDPSIPSANR